MIRSQCPRLRRPRTLAAGRASGKGPEAQVAAAQATVLNSPLALSKKASSPVAMPK